MGHKEPHDLATEQKTNDHHCHHYRIILFPLKVTQLCPTLCNPMELQSMELQSKYSPNTVHGILQTRILEWVAVPFSRGSSQPRDQTQVSCIAGRFFTS